MAEWRSLGAKTEGVAKKRPERKYARLMSSPVVSEEPVATVASPHGSTGVDTAAALTVAIPPAEGSAAPPEAAAPEAVVPSVVPDNAAVLIELRNAVREFLSAADLDSVTIRIIRDGLPPRFSSEIPDFAAQLKSIAVEELSAAKAAADVDEEKDDEDEGDQGEDASDAGADAEPASLPAKKKGRGGGGAFSRPVQLSAALASFLECDDGLMPRAAVTKALWAYIKEKLPRVKGGWACDEKLGAVLKRKVVNFGSLNKELVRHLKDPALLVDAPPAAARRKPAAAETDAADEGSEGEEEEEVGDADSLSDIDGGPSAAATATATAGAKRRRPASVSGGPSVKRAPAPPRKRAPAADSSRSSGSGPTKAAPRPSREERAIAAAAARSAPAKPKAERAKREGGSGGGFGAPQTLSPALAAVVGADAMSRAAVVKALWAYVRAHGLQKAGDGRIFVCDDALRAVMGGRAEISCFKMNRELSRHFLGPASPQPQQQ